MKPATNDALIAVTADYENAVLITAETRLTKRAAQPGITVHTMPELINQLTQDPRQTATGLE